MSGVVIIKETERLSKVIDGATFYYRRVPANIRNQMLLSCTPRSGNTDWGRYGQMLQDYALLGWDNVIDQTTAPIAFSKSMINFLPDRIQGQLIELFGENTTQMQEELKNSPSTPSSST
jgi:hypothetical protein